MKYLINDNQIPGRNFGDSAVFDSKEDIRLQLCDFHSIDWEGLNADDSERDINSLTLNEILDYGEWSIEEISDEEAKKIENN